MSNKVWITIVIILALIIVALTWILFATPAPRSGPVQEATSTQPTTAPTPQPTTASSTIPLDQRVVVAIPKANATVAHTFTITGFAPSAWYFEAVFPIQVRDSDDNLIGTAQGRAQTDWTQPGPIAFKAQITIDASFHGQATLILLKDNPSGLPENMDSVTVPITVK